MIPDSFDLVYSSERVSWLPMNRSTILIVSRPNSFDAVENIAWGYSNNLMLKYVLKTLEQKQGVSPKLGTMFFVRNTYNLYGYRRAIVGMLAAIQAVGDLKEVTVGENDWNDARKAIKNWFEWAL